MCFIKKISPLIPFFLLPLFSYSNETLNVYTYDSFLAKGGIGEIIIPLFNKYKSCPAQFISVGDAGSLVSRLKIEKKQKKIKAHVVIGIDQYLWRESKEFFDLWNTPSWTPENYLKIKKDILIENGFLPFDYGVFTFMEDTKKTNELKIPRPKTLTDLLKPEFKNKLLLQDPRLSTPGLGFLIHSKLALPATDFNSFYKKLRQQWLTLTSGWDQSYSLFLKGEAPFVWSYTTSEAYHIENEEKKENKTRYQAILFEEGHVLQIEGAAMIKNIKNPRLKKCAQKLLSLFLSTEIQEAIPLKNWMYPAREDTRLPLSFQKIKHPNKLLKLSQELSIKSLIQEWEASTGGL